MPCEQNKSIVAVDMGGTSLKCSLINPAYIDSSISKEYFCEMPIDSQGSGPAIIETLIHSIKTVFKKAALADIRVIGIGMCTPGPFDYQKGMSLMKHKFGAIRGLNLKREIAKHLELGEEFPIKFIGDSIAFLIGEFYLGAAQDCARIIGITLGAGIGSGFMANGRIVSEGKGVPPGAGIWCLPYRGGIVEDWISQDAIIRRYEGLGGSLTQDLDVGRLASLAFRGDKTSLQVFEELGSVVGKVLGPIASEFKADCIVFGGGISKSFSLFAKSLKEELQLVPQLKKVVPARLNSLGPLYGVAKEFIISDRGVE